MQKYMLKGCNMDRIIGIIGYGNMGAVIGQRLKSDYQIWVFDKDKDKTQNILDINKADNILELLVKVNVLIFAVKPQDFDIVLVQIKKYIEGKLIISIAAGITTAYIEKKLGKVPVIKVMPNLPAKVGRGIMCLCKGRYSNKEDMDFTRRLFDYFGKTMLIEERLMNAATAISGSGPGFFYDLIKGRQKEYWQSFTEQEFIPALSASAQKLGFTLEQAQLLAESTAQGSIVLLKETGISPEVLCAQVTSKGGTTEAGLKALHNTNSLEEAAKAALIRAEELSK